MNLKEFEELERLLPSDAELKDETRRKKQAQSITGRKRKDQSERMSGDSNIMAGKVSPNRGKEMPQISSKLKGKKKSESHAANISKARKGVPIPKLQGRKKPEQSARLKISNPGFDATRIAWTCEHCGKEGVGSSNFKRWHSDNCKAKK